MVGLEKKFCVKAMRRMCCIVFFLASVLLSAASAHAATIQRYSDTLTDSAPSERSDHTVQFRTMVGIPAGGYIRIVPSPGDFDIPAADFDVDNIEIYTSTGSGFVQRIATSTQSMTEDGITITPGTSGTVEITLNSSTGIPADADVRVIMGVRTQNATGTDVSILNPSASGTYPIYIEAGGGGSDTSVTARVAIVDNIAIRDVDTTETEPPIRFNGAPAGIISGTTLAVQMSLETNEFAKCRYSTASGTPYFSMGNEFTTSFRTIHPKNVSVATGTTYTFYVRCIDDESNVNTDDYIITFTVPEYPEGDPGEDGSGEGTGSGTGTGTGDSGSGSGSSGGGSSGATTGGSGGGGGSGSGGGSSGASGGDSGGFEGTIKAYQSGDGRVIINGYAFPGSTVVALVDGTAAEQVRASNSGEFSITIDAIARGVYTFGVYATDREGTRSTTFSTTFTVTGARGSTLSNINVMPSIKVSPDPVDQNSTVTFSGYAIPSATITVENQSDKSKVSLKSFTTTSDSSGKWSLDVDTTGFSAGTYKVRAKAVQEGAVSTNFSGYTFYGVGQAAAVPRSSDLNRDGKVNLTDFSILLFWWNSDGGTSNPPADINGDGKVSLTDFSIMIFNWTG